MLLTQCWRNIQRCFTESVTKWTASPQEPKKYQHYLLNEHNLKTRDTELTLFWSLPCFKMFWHHIYYSDTFRLWLPWLVTSCPTLHFFIYFFACSEFPNKHFIFNNQIHSFVQLQIHTGRWTGQPLNFLWLCKIWSCFIPLSVSPWCTF